ncbi:glycosyltransferase family 1 protein [Cylindrobasidium torrendii FP15055 ss-10]|uniref:UDP-N-acetylglucosamine transferase subunit ALG13 n=1 Tax=Cylindrobasidium torrendii FP15055 ss-10 TaxID=1314674 RepID=A0A0D7BDJ3_9AGAR|nr:glycosyltransferase family 1 protein [Cylindrobasidium torrendii FP15055 ss-10]
MLAFVTVGSTRFDALVHAATTTDVLKALKSKGFTRLIIQCGNSDVAKDNVEEQGIQIEAWRFKPTLQDTFNDASLVISHAGSGTILDVLRIDKWLIVVPNPTLLDNHQEELAESLSKLGHLKATTVSGLADTIAAFDPATIVPFPKYDGTKFRAIIDEELGF